MKHIYLALMMQFLLVACGQHSSNVAQAPAAATAPAMPTMGRGISKMAVDIAGGAEQSLSEISEPRHATSMANAEQTRKYIALRHHLQIETQAEKMQAAFDAAVEHCEALNCQILSAIYSRETPYSPPSASLYVRVPPRNIEIFLSGLAKSGEIMQHSRESEDKTNQVVDTDARIKNLTELRDRLRLMLNDKSAKFKDIIEVQRELANT